MASKITQKDLDNNWLGGLIGGLAAGAFIVFSIAFLFWPTNHERPHSVEACPSEYKMLGYSCRIDVVPATTEEKVDDLQGQVSTLKEQVATLQALPTAKKEAEKKAKDEAAAEEKAEKELREQQRGVVYQNLGNGWVEIH